MQNRIYCISFGALRFIIVPALISALVIWLHITKLVVQSTDTHTDEQKKYTHTHTLIAFYNAATILSKSTLRCRNSIAKLFAQQSDALMRQTYETLCDF